MKQINNVEELYYRLDRRWNADSPLLRYAHRKKFEKILKMVKKNESLLDLGRGGSVDGVLGVLAAIKGAKVTISNVTDNNLSSIKEFAESFGVENKITFVKASPQTGNLFKDNSFDMLISLHVLEHLENFDQGLETIHRITKRHAIIALPTCLNPCVWIRLGGQSQGCYHFSIQSFKALFIGIGKVAKAFLINADGVIEDQTEDNGNKWNHLWRFPWKMREAFAKHGFIVKKFGPDTMCLPWFQSLIPLSNFLDKVGYLRIVNNFGYGSHALIEKVETGFVS